MRSAVIILDILFYLILYIARITSTAYQWRAALHGIRRADSEIALPKNDKKIHDERIDVARKAYKSKYLDILSASAAVAVVSIAIWLAYEKLYKHDKSFVLKDSAAICILSVPLEAISNVVSS